jgi:hypothetical protein
MSSSDVHGLTGIGEMSPCGSCLNPSHPSLRSLIVLEMSDPELKSGSTGVGTLGCLCASASLLIRSSSRCSLSTSSVLSGGLRWRSSSETLVVHNWPSCKSFVCALMSSNTVLHGCSSGLALWSMPGALGLTVALETTDWVGDTEVGGVVVWLWKSKTDIRLMKEGTVIQASKGVSWMRESLTEMAVLKVREGKRIWG